MNLYIFLISVRNLYTYILLHGKLAVHVWSRNKKKYIYICWLYRYRCTLVSGSRKSYIHGVLYKSSTYFETTTRARTRVSVVTAVAAAAGRQTITVYISRRVVSHVFADVFGIDFEEISLSLSLPRVAIVLMTERVHVYGTLPTRRVSYEQVLNIIQK